MVFRVRAGNFVSKSLVATPHAGKVKTEYLGPMTSSAVYLAELPAIKMGLEIAEEWVTGQPHQYNAAAQRHEEVLLGIIFINEGR